MTDKITIDEVYMFRSLLDKAEKNGDCVNLSRKYWCNTHQREATHITINGKLCCDPKLGGILLPCSVVILEDVEIEQ